MKLQESVDVVVVGGGPIGLQLAGELRLAGASVIVLERLAAPSSTIKAGSVGPQSAELFDRRGTLEPMREAAVDLFATLMPSPAAGTPSPAGPKPGNPFAGGSTPPATGHFAGLWLLRRYPAATTAPLFAPQHLVEVVLEAWVRELGAQVRRERVVTGFVERPDAVDVGVDDGSTVTASYVVGCDGGRSLVRKLAGFDFPGTGPTITGRQALVELADPEVLDRGWNRTSAGTVVFGPGANRVLTVEFDGPPAERESPVTAAEIEGSLRRVSGREVRVTGLTSGTRWTDNTRQASVYRRGRIVLAGDAAHVHPPFGGQGLNLGLQDAANLGWKLAAEIAGRAPAGLLDSYSTERHPVAARALANTRAQVALMRPDPQTNALRDLFTDLLAFDDANAHVSRLMTSADAVYEVGCAHPAAGRLVVDREVLVDDRPMRLFERLRCARTTFVAASSAVQPPSGVDAVRAKDGPSMLIRPDGIVAWAGDDPRGLDEALTRWV